MAGEYSLALDQAKYVAGIQSGSKFDAFISDQVGTPSKLRAVAATMGLNPDFKPKELPDVMAQVVQTQARTAPLEARLNHDALGEGHLYNETQKKATIIGQAWDDLFSGRADSLKGEYGKGAAVNLTPSGESGIEQSLRALYRGPINQAKWVNDKILAPLDRVMMAPLVLGMGAFAEAGKQTGLLSEDQAQSWYDSMSEWADVIDLGLGLVGGLGAYKALNTTRAIKAFKKVGDTIEALGRAGKLSPEAVALAKKHSLLTTVNRYIDYGRGIMVMNPATSARNFTNVIMRKGVDEATKLVEFGLDSTVLNLRRAMGIADEGVSPAEAISTLRTIAKKRKFGKVISALEEFDSAEVNKMYSKFVGDLDVDKSDKIRRFIDKGNVLNWAQEKFHRDTKFLQVLDDELRHNGFTHGLDDLFDASGAVNKAAVKDIPVELVQRASDEALYHTFAKEPDTGWAAPFYKALNEGWFGAAAKATGLPYPRYGFNALQYIGDYSPHHILEARKLFAKEPLSRQSLNEIARGITSLVGLGTLYEFHPYGDKWDEMEINGQLINTKSLLGPYALPFQAAHIAKVMSGEVEGELDFNDTVLDFVDNLALIPNAYETGAYQLKTELKQITDYMKDTDSDMLTALKTHKLGQSATTLLANFAARYVAPFRTAKDILSLGFDSEAVRREIYKSPGNVNIRPLTGKIPLLSNIVPENYVPTRAGPYKKDMTLGKLALNLVGLTTIDKNFIERELDKYGFGNLNRRSGSYDYDVMMNERMGQYMEGYSAWLKTDPLVTVEIDKGDEFVAKYSDLAKDPKTKKVFLQRLVVTARDRADLDVQKYMEEQGMDEARMQLRYSRINKSVVDMKVERGYNTLEAIGGYGRPRLNSNKVMREQTKGILPKYEYTPE